MACVLLAACSGKSESPTPDTMQDLETAAIERGLVREPGDSEAAGLFARDGDRLCLVPRSGGYQVGVYVSFGETLNCTAQGRATRSGQRLSIEFGKSGGRCRFDARFEGDRILFPPSLPAECAALCPARATFTALTVERLGETVAEASAARTSDGTRLCPD